MSGAVKLLKFGRAEIAECRVPPLTVVPDFEVLEDGGEGERGRSKGDVMSCATVLEAGNRR